MKELVKDIADQVSRKKIAEVTGTGLTAVSNAVARNRFPASWYFAVKSLCDAECIDCPPEAFGMVQYSQDVDLPPDCQDLPERTAQ